MNNKRVFGLTLSALAMATLAACSTTSGVEDMQELQAYHWTQINMISSDGNSEPAFHSEQGGPVVLNFDNNKMMISGLCNAMIAQYTTQGDKMKVSSPAATMKACGDQELMRYEHQVGQSLHTISNWSLLSTNATDAAPVLVLSFDDGSKWRLKGEPTAETKYGAPATTVFMEVAPEKVSCSTPQTPEQLCLRLREITYNESGIKTQQGPWLDYFGDIKGYEHTPGIRQVIRVKRYPLNNVSGDKANFADELDMIVESEVMPR